MGSQYACSIAVIGKRPTFDDRSCAIRIALGDGRGAILRVVGVGVHYSVFDAAGHIAVGVVLVRVRPSAFDGNRSHCMRDGRAVRIG